MSCGTLVAEANILKGGKRLVVGQVALIDASGTRLDAPDLIHGGRRIAHASVTYSLPPK